jgi:hypothetical protein
MGECYITHTRHSNVDIDRILCLPFLEPSNALLVFIRSGGILESQVHASISCVGILESQVHAYISCVGFHMSLYSCPRAKGVRAGRHATGNRKSNVGFSNWFVLFLVVGSNR